MTIEESLAKVAAELDVVIARNRARFEQSLIDNHAPADPLGLLLEWEHDHVQAWRTRTLDEVRAKLQGGA